MSMGDRQSAIDAEWNLSLMAKCSWSDLELDE